MKTNAKERERWGKFLGGGVMANLTPSEARHLIADVDDAVGLLENACQEKLAAVAILLDAERHIFSGGRGQQTSTLQEKVIRARKLLERTAPYANFLKEPSDEN